jgi:hypothetical protein
VSERGCEHFYGTAWCTDCAERHYADLREQSHRQLTALVIAFLHEEGCAAKIEEQFAETERRAR